MKKIDDEMLDEFEKDFQEAVAPLEDKYEMKIKLNNITYADDSFKARLVCEKWKTPEEETIAQNKLWNDWAAYLGLPENLYGRRILDPHNGFIYTIGGIDESAKKYKVVLYQGTVRSRCKPGFVRRCQLLENLDVIDMKED